jgi:hypothetical protein
MKVPIDDNFKVVGWDRLTVRTSAEASTQLVAGEKEFHCVDRYRQLEIGGWALLLCQGLRGDGDGMGNCKNERRAFAGAAFDSNIALHKMQIILDDAQP